MTYEQAVAVLANGLEQDPQKILDAAVVLQAEVGRLKRAVYAAEREIERLRGGGKP